MCWMAVLRTRAAVVKNNELKSFSGGAARYCAGRSWDLGLGEPLERSRISLWDHLNSTNMHIVNNLTLGCPATLNTDVILSTLRNTRGKSRNIALLLTTFSMASSTSSILVHFICLPGKKTSWFKPDWSKVCEVRWGEPLKSVESNRLLSEISGGLSTNCEGSWLRHCNFYIFLMGWIQTIIVYIAHYLLTVRILSATGHLSWRNTWS